jgi:hypothetical protein
MSGEPGKIAVWYRTRSQIGILDIQTMKCYTIFTTPLQFDALGDFQLDVRVDPLDRQITLHTLEYENKTYSAVKAIKFSERSL